MSDLKNYFVVKEYNSVVYVNSDVYNERIIGIGICNKESGITVPSPLTNYIKSLYRGKNGSLSSQRNAAYELIKFLNYINEQIIKDNESFIDLKEDGIFGLDIHHASDYVSFQSERANAKLITANYVYRMEEYLINFYKWLQLNKLISTTINFNNTNPLKNLDLDTLYPRGTDEDNIKNRLADFGENRLDLLEMFINIALDITPEIALGICFQVFGGLRKGEVVNLTKDSIEFPYYWSEDDFGENKFILQIRDRADILFTSKKNTSHEQVKRPRNQALLVNSILSNIYKEHKQLLSR